MLQDASNQQGASGAEDASRTAFSLSALHARRDGTRITAVTLDGNLHRLFLGLSSGYVEEHQLITASHFSRGVHGHRLSHTGGTTTASLQASAAAGTRIVSGRKVFKHGIADLCCLPVAQRLVARSSEGSVMVCPYEGSELIPVELLKRAIAIAGDGLLKSYARLAAICKPGNLAGGPACKLIVCMIGTGPGGTTSSSSQQVQRLAEIAIQEPAVGVAWAGDSIILALPTCYRLFASGGAATDIAPHTCPQPLLSTVLPLREAAVLLADTMIVVVDYHGTAVSAPLLLGSFPLAISCIGNQLLAVTDEGVEVYDRLSGSRIQQISFIHDDAWVQAARKMPCCEDWGLQQVLFATSDTLYCLSPVSEEAQVMELLKKRRYAAALSLIASVYCRDEATPPSSPAAPSSPTWCHHAVAQAALQLLQECAFLPALALLLHLPPSVWQPCQLFYLFPQETSKWLHDIPQHPGQASHAFLPDLKRLIADWVELQHSTRPSQTGGYQLSAGYQSATDSPSHAASTEQEAHNMYLYTLAQALVACYFLQARQAEGLVLQDALDTLMLQLLSDIHAAGLLEQVVCMSDLTAPLREAVMLLTRANRWHALALLRASHNHCEEALDIWSNLVTRSATEDTKHLQGSNQTNTNNQQDDNVMNSPAVSFYALVTLFASAPSVGSMTGNASNSPTAAATNTLPTITLSTDLSHIHDVYEKACMQWSATRHLHDSSGSFLGNVPSQAGLEAGMLAGLPKDWPASGLQAANVDQAALAATSMTMLMSSLPITPDESGEVHSELPETAQSVTGLTVRVSGKPQPTAVITSPTVGQMQHFSGNQVIRQQGLQKQQHKPAQSSAALKCLEFAHAWTNAKASNVTLPVRVTPRDAVACDLVLSKLPLLLETFPGDALQVLQARTDLPLPQVLQCLIDRTDDTRWRFLHHLVYSKVQPAVHLQPASQPDSSGVVGSSSLGSAPTTEADIAALHTELALELVECIAREANDKNSSSEPVAATGIAQQHDSTAPAPQQQQTISASQTEPLGQASIGHGVVSMSGSLPPYQQPICKEPQSRLEWLRLVLSTHLSESKQYDPAIVLEAVHTTCPGILLREEVQLYCRLGNHTAALHIVVVKLQDIDAAIGYCRSQQQEMQSMGNSTEVAARIEALWLALLECCLRPGDGLEPMYGAAIRVLAAPSLSGNLEGGTPQLDPLKVLGALPGSMPLALAKDTLASMMISSGHRKRSVQVLRALYKAQNLELKAQTLELSCQILYKYLPCLLEDSLPAITKKLIIRLPSGVLLCDRCAQPE